MNNKKKTCNKLLLSLKMEENSDTCYNTDETGVHCVKGSKPVTKRQIVPGTPL
jgi:hypothetical protein